MTFPAWGLVWLLITFAGCSPSASPPPAARAPSPVPQKFLGDEVTCDLPKHWKAGDASLSPNSETRHFRFLGMAGQGKSIFAHVLFTADQTPQPPPVERVAEYQRENFKIPKDNETVVDDVIAGHWRTVISTGKSDDFPALILDQHIVESGTVLTIRMVHPLDNRNSSAVLRAVDAFNAVAASLKIHGTNSSHCTIEIVAETVRIHREDGVPSGKSIPLPGPR